MTIFNWEYINI